MGGDDKSIVKSKLLKACFICAIFMVIEFLAGWIANSLALMTDAVHLLSDLSSFLISLFAIWVSTLPGTSTLSFGYHRAEILGALLSVLMIWIITAGLCYEAVGRIRNPCPVNGRLMFATALMGTVANIFMTYILGVHSHGLGGHSSDDHGGCCHGHDHGPHRVMVNVNPIGPGPLSQSTPQQSPAQSPAYKAAGGAVTDSCGEQCDQVCGDLQASCQEQHKSCGGGHSHSHSMSTKKVQPEAFPSLMNGKCKDIQSHDSCGHSKMSPRKKICEASMKTMKLNQLSLGEAHGDIPDSHYVSLSDNGEDESLEREVESINLRAAYIHAVGDLIQNIGVMVAAGLIWWKPHFQLADPLCTLLFSLFVVLTTFQIIVEAMNVLMEGAPARVDIELLARDLQQVPGVCEIHDLHVWSLSVGKPSLACHLVVDVEENARRALRIATDLCQRKHSIDHTTIQIDFSMFKVACDTNAHSKCHTNPLG